MKKALEELGYKVKGHAPKLLNAAITRNKSRIMHGLRGYDAIEDAPWFMLYKEIDEWYPGSKFILTIRDEESWYRSAHGRLKKGLQLKSAWIYGSANAYLNDKEAAIQVYRDHNRAVQEYFSERPDDLVVMNLPAGDGWEKLCPFLGKPIPGDGFVEANITSRNVEIQHSKLRHYRKHVQNKVMIEVMKMRGHIS